MNPQNSNTPAGFSQIDTWIFDLDNTLYPPRYNLFGQVDERMSAYIARELVVPLPEAKRLQKSYYRKYGTTLHGLMLEHDVDPTPYLEYVHDIDAGVIERDTQLDGALDRLEGDKFIFTNGSRAHAENVVSRLGIGRHFTDIFDIVDAGYVPKPSAAAYTAFLKKASVEPRRASMFEDLEHNLKVPHELGMTTVWVRHADHPDGPDRHQPGFDNHVHHITESLADFLCEIQPPSEDG